MEFPEVVRKRRMVRHFAADPIDPAAIDRILDAAKHAPSAGFTQGQFFVVVTTAETKQAIAKLCGEEEYVAGGLSPSVIAHRMYPRPR